MNKILTVLLCSLLSVQAFALSVGDLRVMTARNPQGVDATPEFYWKLTSDERGVMQTAYRLVITSDAAGADVVWDSGLVSSAQSVGVPATGAQLLPSTRYYWHVSVTDNKGHEAQSSETAYFDTGLMGSGWSGAQWIKATETAYGDTAKSEEIADYTIEGKFEIAEVAAGIVFAAKDQNNCYMWQFNVEGSFPRFRPHVWAGGNVTCLANVDLTGKVDLKAGKEYTYKIVITGASHAATYLDGVLIDERDGNFGYGKLGFRAAKGESSSTAYEKAYYDDIRVTKADGEATFSADFSGSNPFDGGELKSGRLYVECPTSKNVVLTFQKDGSASSHFRIETDMTLINASAAIVFGYTSAGNYHMWQINTLDNADHPLVRPHIYIGGSYTTANYDITDFTKAQLLSHRRHVTIEADGNLVKTYIDSVLVNTFTDESGTLTLGRVGFRVHSNAGERAYFDNVKVTSYDANGKATVTLDEDFEKGVSDHFLTADIENYGGSHQLYMTATSGENFLVESTVGGGASMFRKAFTAKGKVRSARLYTTALGVYNAYINGQRVGTIEADGTTSYDELMPGWTDYTKRVFYNSHDVTPLLREGSNVLGAVVASGWWAGAIAHGRYGAPTPGFMARLIITYEDGTQDNIVSDLSWASYTGGPVCLGEIYNGEYYDARREADFFSPSYDAAAWHAVARNTEFKGEVSAFEGPQVRILKDHILPVSSTTIYQGTTASGTTYGKINTISTLSGPASYKLSKGQNAVIDFGQNFAGWVKIRVKGAAGTRLHFKFGEMTNDDGDRGRGNDGPGGSVYTENLRSAKAELNYILSGSADGEEYHPSTTFYGFRYAELTTTADVEIESIEGQPISSSTEDVGDITTSSKIINQLVSNIRWGQRSNLLSIPTDCPQRDERLGWTADTQVFSTTGMYNANTESFYRKWMGDMRDSQRDDGAYPDVAPYNWVGYGNAAWADAGILVPWKMYRMYGNKEVLRENYASMEKYMNWLSQQTGDGYKYQGAGTAYGDWVAYVTTDSRFCSVAYYAHDAEIMALVSDALSESAGDEYAQKAAAYRTLFNNIKAEFKTRYLAPNGMPKSTNTRTQTGYLMSLQYNLLPSTSAQLGTKVLLRSAITGNDYKLNTGFLGTAILNTTLSRFNMNDLAYTLLLQRSNPSWLYPIDQGATTMWERWNSYTLDSGFGPVSMNSFNHYAYGAIGEWMYRYMAGIEADDSVPGFRHIILQPTPDNRSTIPSYEERITSVDGSYNGNYGLITSAWTSSDGKDIDYRCTVPANSTATLYLPVSSADKTVYEGDKVATKAEGVEYVGYKNGKQVYRLGSGSYHFSTQVPSGVKKQNIAAGLRLWPNPTTGKLNIDSDKTIKSLKLFTASGSKVIELSDTRSREIDMSAMPSGLYLLETLIDGETSVHKIVKI